MSQLLICKEFEPLEVPLDLLIIDGRVNIYPGVDKYFDIDYRNGRIVIAPKSFVGLIPVNSRLTLRVVPRFPVNNLFYILARSLAKLHFIRGQQRAFELLSASSGDPLEILVNRFAESCIDLCKTGVAMRYSGESESPPFVGNFALGETIGRFWSRGYRHELVWTSDEFSSQTLENRLIRSALARVIAYTKASREPSAKKRMPALVEADRLLASVDPLASGAPLSVHEIEQALSFLPRHRQDYHPIVWLSFLLHSKRGIAIESSGQISFDTFVVNLAEVFEDYVRSVVRDAFESQADDIRVFDGNLKQVPLFVNQQSNQVKPDVYVIRSNQCVLIVDAKYKLTLKASDRYEVLAFCEALECKKAILVSPAAGGQQPSPPGRTPGGVELVHINFNLAADPIRHEELAFVNQLQEASAAALVLPYTVNGVLRAAKRYKVGVFWVAVQARRGIGTVSCGIKKLGLLRLKSLEPPVAVVRCERRGAGELLRLGTKKLVLICGGAIASPAIHARPSAAPAGTLHLAIDDQSLVSFALIKADVRCESCA